MVNLYDHEIYRCPSQFTIKHPKTIYVPQQVHDRKVSVAEQLVELAVHDSEGKIGSGVSDISHHKRGCPCERCILNRLNNVQPRNRGDTNDIKTT